jgi:hypothetical protein
MTSTDRPRGGHHYTDEEMHNEAVAYEHSDINMRRLLAFAGALTLVVATAAGLMYGLFMVFEKQAEKRDPQLTPLAAPAGQAPQGPRLLTNEPQNLRRFREEENAKLVGYGWMDQSQGIAKVPVDLAKKLVVQHGLPARAGTTPDDTLGTNAPAYGEASGGRTIPVKHAAPPAPPAGSEPQPAGGEQPSGVQQPGPPKPPAGAAQEIKK